MEMIKIYKLIHNAEIVYVGKTTQDLIRRKTAGYGNTVSFYKECSMELIEETDDVSRERYWIEKLISEGHPLLNKRGGESGLDKKEYNKEYKEKNKEYKKEYNKEYKEKNKEYYKECYKEWREKNKEYYKEYQREYYRLKKIN
jgi:hypothetical protein